MTEAEILQKYSTPGLRRCKLTRASKKLNLEFDPQFSSMTQRDRDEFLDRYFPSTAEVVEVLNASGAIDASN